MSRRTKKIILTKENRVFRKLRAESGLSMKALEEKTGVQSSYIAQLSTGRANFSKTKTIMSLLKAMGISEKQFDECVQNYKEEKSTTEIISEYILRMSESDQKSLIRFAEFLMATKKSNY